MLLTEFDEKAFREGIHEEGYDEGRKDGKLEGRNEVLIGLVQDKIITVEEAAKRAGLTEAEFEKFLSEHGGKTVQKDA